MIAPTGNIRFGREFDCLQEFQFLMLNLVKIPLKIIIYLLMGNIFQPQQFAQDTGDLTDRSEDLQNSFTS